MLFTYLCTFLSITIVSADYLYGDHLHNHYNTEYASHYNDYKPRDYKFEYGVSDPHTGDHKSQWEVRENGVVRGAYSLLEPDGTTRIVDYYADHTGFHADVKKIGHAIHATPEIHQHSLPLKTIADSITYSYGHGGLENSYGALSPAQVITPAIHQANIIPAQHHNDFIHYENVPLHLEAPVNKYEVPLHYPSAPVKFEAPIHVESPVHYEPQELPLHLEAPQHIPLNLEAKPQIYAQIAPQFEVQHQQFDTKQQIPALLETPIHYPTPQFVKEVKIPAQHDFVDINVAPHYEQKYIQPSNYIQESHYPVERIGHQPVEPVVHVQPIVQFAEPAKKVVQHQQQFPIFSNFAQMLKFLSGGFRAPVKQQQQVVYAQQPYPYNQHGY